MAKVLMKTAETQLVKRLLRRVADISLATPSLLSPKYLNIYLLNYPR